MTLEQAKKIAQSVPLATDGIILEILLRLPVESLLRCKSVCKSWRSLISDPFFIKSHLNLSSSSITTNNRYAHHRIIFTGSSEKNMKSCPLNDVLFEKSVVNSLKHVYPSYSHHLHHKYLDHTIVGSCNGLVCIVCKPSEVDMLFIWNPSTKISTTLYSTTFDLPLGMRYKAMYGFAYEKATDDYKVVSVYPCDQYQYRVKIYLLKTGNWKHIGEFPHGYRVNKSGVFSNGYLHWMATRRGANGLNYPCTIVSFDLANVTFGEVSQPVYFDEDDKALSLGVLGEWLCVLCNYRELTRADVWVMKVYGVEDSWTKLASVTFPADTYSRFALPLFISNDGTILLQAEWKLVVYDSRDGSCSEIENLNLCYDVTTCVESLVSPYIPPSALDDKKLMMI